MISAATLCPDHTKKYLIHVSENVFFLNNSCAELYIQEKPELSKLSLRVSFEAHISYEPSKTVFFISYLHLYLNLFEFI